MIIYKVSWMPLKIIPGTFSKNVPAECSKTFSANVPWMFPRKLLRTFDTNALWTLLWKVPGTFSLNSLWILLRNVLSIFLLNVPGPFHRNIQRTLLWNVKKTRTFFSSRNVPWTFRWNLPNIPRERSYRTFREGISLWGLPLLYCTPLAL